MTCTSATLAEIELEEATHRTKSIHQQEREVLTHFVFFLIIFPLVPCVFPIDFSLGYSIVFMK